MESIGTLAIASWPKLVRGAKASITYPVRGYNKPTHLRGFSKLTTANERHNSKLTKANEWGYSKMTTVDERSYSKWTIAHVKAIAS